MRKIPCVFRYDDDHVITLEPNEWWVLDGYGVATAKLDGTNVRVTVRSGHCVRLEKRRNPTRAQKNLGIIDPWYVDANRNDPADQYIWEAVDGANFSSWPDGEHSCEALGPKIQGNPHGYERHWLYAFSWDPRKVPEVPRTRDSEELIDAVGSLGDEYEGVVWHHFDGRMAKLTREHVRRYREKQVAA